MTRPDGSFPTTRSALLARLGPSTLDDDTAERLLRAAVDPGDAPPEYRGVAAALQCLAQPATPTEQVDPDDTVTAMSAAIEVAARPHRVRPRLLAAKTRRAAVAAGVFAGGLVLTTGLAVAGALPSGAQRMASNVLGTFGISAPDPAAHTVPPPDRVAGSPRGGPSGSTDPTGSTAPGLGGGATAHDSNGDTPGRGTSTGPAPTDHGPAVTPTPGPTGHATGGASSAHSSSNGHGAPDSPGGGTPGP